MHGGGHTTSAKNDQQWHNQILLADQYGIDEGVVVTPRAPVDAWNMWFQYDIDDLFEDLIFASTMFEDVNPNKVYIVGYSAGGDGTYRLATHMADHWASASMSAEHPGESHPANLRNIKFALNMGAEDASFNRINQAREWKEQLEILRASDPEGYDHRVNIFKNRGHWMHMDDKIAIPYISSFTRQPYPNKIVWRQNAFRIRNNFYWLDISEEDANAPDLATNPNKVINVSASFDKNYINIEENYANTLYIYLNDKMIDLDKALTVCYKGKVIFQSDKIKRNIFVIAQTAASRKKFQSNDLLKDSLGIDDI